jgi:diguanylate cyclase (GGDEF)-like protein
MDKKRMQRITENSDTAVKQALRMRRFFMALTAYAACGTLAQAYAWIGYLPTWVALGWIAGVAAVNVVFFLAFRLGWNLRMRDASMTQLQIAVSMVALLVLISQVDQGRNALQMLLLMPMLFGVLRLNFRQMARVGLVGVAGYGVVIAIGLHTHSEHVRLELELLNLGSLTGVMIFVCIMCGYISKVREDLAVALTRIRELAERDPLTGLFNRRALLGKLDTEIGRCERRLRRGITLCMVDIDRFKRINDTFGHPVGDEVIRLVGECLGASVRVIDGVFRYGGEEFIVLFEDDSAGSALATCERMRSRVAQLRIPSAPELTPSVSIGVTCFSLGENGSDLIARADKALYLAKSNGRNCVFEAPPLTSVTAAIGPVAEDSLGLS